MNDFFVYTEACASGEAAVTEKGGSCALLFDKRADLFVQILGGNTRLYKPVGIGEGLTGDPSGGAHQLQLIGIFDHYHSRFLKFQVLQG